VGHRFITVFINRNTAHMTELSIIHTYISNLVLGLTCDEASVSCANDSVPPTSGKD